MIYKKRFLFELFFILILLFFAQRASSLCARADIDYYLSKGFTPTQITKICSASKEGDRLDPSRNIPSANQAHEVSGVNFLASAIAATDISFISDSFSYVTRECIDYDLRPISTVVNPKRFCGAIRKTIAYRGLSVVNNALISGITFFDKPSIAIKGHIQYEVLNINQLSRLTKHDYKLFMKTLNQIKVVSIPIRQDFLIEKVKIEIKKIAQ